MKKKLVSVLLASALVASCMTGCGNSGSDAASDDSAAAVDDSADAVGGVKRSRLEPRLP